MQLAQLGNTSVASAPEHLPLASTSAAARFHEQRAALAQESIVNKADFTGQVANVAELSKADAARAIDAAIEIIKKALKNGDTVTLIGFGTFSVRKRAERQGRNPQTGATIKVKASKNPAFKAGKAFKDAVN